MYCAAYTIKKKVASPHTEISTLLIVAWNEYDDSNATEELIYFSLLESHLAEEMCNVCQYRKVSVPM